MSMQDALAQCDLFQDAPPALLARLAEHCGGVKLEPNARIYQQHDLARFFYLLVSGTVQQWAPLEESGELFLVDLLQGSNTPLDWACLRPPFRHMEAARSETETWIVRIPREALDEALSESGTFGVRFLRRLAGLGSERLARARGLLIDSRLNAEAFPSPTVGMEHGVGPLEGGRLLDDIEALREWVRHGPFFEGVSRDIRERFLALGRLEELRPGEVLFRAGEPANRFFLLAEGRLRLQFASTEDGSPSRVPFHQTFSHAGQSLGWTALVEAPHYDATATAFSPSRLLVFERLEAEALFVADPPLGLATLMRVLWVIGNRLRALRIRQIAQRYDQESVAIGALIDQHAPQLAISSPLRKIPHFLSNRLTLSDAFQVLENVAVEGSVLERQLAENCLELMGKVGEDLSFFKRLQTVYERVVGAPSTWSPEQVRTRCNMEFGELFRDCRRVVRGLENLPEQPGCIFIMNHLVNHPVNQLPGGFLLTLDTHFVSSMILFPHYEQNPIRVVRRSDLNEYEHQQYFDRLDYIYVGGPADGSEDQRAARIRDREAFYHGTETLLASGRNLLICPEGNTTSTEESPLPFRMGAFAMAARLRPEPLIVPIVVANFDKPLTRRPVAAMVHAPFRLSDRAPDPRDREELAAFVEALRGRYREWVAEAARLAETVAEP